nr:MAG TPA: putative RNA methyltransferase [Caudoviricetes sp.]
MPSYLCPVYGRCGGGLVRSLRSRRFFIFSP